MHRALPLAVAIGSLAGCGSPQVTVQTPLGVINFAPQDGAVNVDPAADEGICFNRQVDAPTAVALPTVTDASGNAVAGVTVSNATNQGTSDPFCLAVSHPALLAGTPYQILVPQGLTASDGSTLAAAITSRFRTASP